MFQVQAKISSSPIGSSALYTVTPFFLLPIRPARALPCPTYSCIYDELAARGLFINLMLEAVRLSETSVSISSRFKYMTLGELNYLCSFLSLLLHYSFMGWSGICN
jgi:hypothetical protein